MAAPVAAGAAGGILPRSRCICFPPGSMTLRSPCSLLGWLRPPARLLWCLLVWGAALRCGARPVHSWLRAGSPLLCRVPGLVVRFQEGCELGSIFSVSLLSFRVLLGPPCVSSWAAAAESSGSSSGLSSFSSSSGKACIPTMGAAWFHVIPAGL